MIVDDNGSGENKMVNLQRSDLATKNIKILIRLLTCGNVMMSGAEMLASQICEM